MGSKTPNARTILFGAIPVKVVAARTGFHLSYLYLVLQRRRRLSWDGAEKVASALKISLDELRAREKRLKAAAKKTARAYGRARATARTRAS